MTSDGLLPIEVFATGTFTSATGREVTFTERDLDAIVANFSALRDVLKPPLKAGHSTSQVLMGQSDGDPALGWVARLARIGSKLVAYVQDMPRVVRDAIAAGRYRRVSAELLLDWGATQWEKNLRTGVTGPVLEGVALLGADLPQVASLADLGTYLSTHPAGGEVERLAATQALSPEISAAYHESVADKPNDSIPKEAAMAEDIAALRATVEAQAQQLETLRLEADTRVKAAAEAEAAERLKLAAEVDRLRCEADALRRDRDAALHRQRELDALAYADRYCTGEAMRVLPAQRAWLAALHRHLAQQGDAVALAASEAERLQCAEAGQGADLTALGLLEAFLAAGPDHRVLCATMPKAPPEHVADDYDTVIAAIAQRERLNLSVPTERAKAAGILATERPDLTGARRAA